MKLIIKFDKVVQQLMSMSTEITWVNRYYRYINKFVYSKDRLGSINAFPCVSISIASKTRSLINHKAFH